MLILIFGILLQLTEDAAAGVEAAMSLVEAVMENVCAIVGLSRFQTAKDEVLFFQ